MKKLSAFILLFCFVAVTASVFAKPYKYPVEKPVFTITFPDSWNVELNSQDVAIFAQSPDNEIEYDIWALPAKDVDQDVKAAINDAVGEVNSLIEQYMSSAAFGDWKWTTKNDIDFMWAEGEGRYKEENQKVYVEVDFFSPDDKTVYILMYWGTKQGEKKYADDIKAIDKSIKRVK